MILLHWSIDASPIPVESVHQFTAVAGDSYASPDFRQQTSKLLMLFVGHLKPIRFGVAPGLMWIGRVTIKQSFLIIVEADDFHCWTVLNLYSKKTLGYNRQHVHTAKPARNNTRHSAAAGIFAIGPPSQRRGLSQSSANLASANKEA